MSTSYPKLTNVERALLEPHRWQLVVLALASSAGQFTLCADSTVTMTLIGVFANNGVALEGST
jgi:hypothetical protein